jgi:hypothetical protein
MHSLVCRGCPSPYSFVPAYLSVTLAVANYLPWMPFWTLRSDVRQLRMCLAAGHFIYLIRQRQVLPVKQCCRNAPPFPTPPYPIFLICDDITSFSFFVPSVTNWFDGENKACRAQVVCRGTQTQIGFIRRSLRDLIFSATELSKFRKHLYEGHLHLYCRPFRAGSSLTPNEWMFSLANFN